MLKWIFAILCFSFLLLIVRIYYSSLFDHNLDLRPCSKLNYLFLIHIFVGNRAFYFNFLLNLCVELYSGSYYVLQYMKITVLLCS